VESHVAMLAVCILPFRSGERGNVDAYALAHAIDFGNASRPAHISTKPSPGQSTLLMAHRPPPDSALICGTSISGRRRQRCTHSSAEAISPSAKLLHSKTKTKPLFSVLYHM
jgi:hypothetical protein